LEERCETHQHQVDSSKVKTQSINYAAIKKRTFNKTKTSRGYQREDQEYWLQSCIIVARHQRYLDALDSARASKGTTFFRVSTHLSAISAWVSLNASHLSWLVCALI
jgi:hypothetical protein